MWSRHLVDRHRGLERRPDCELEIEVVAVVQGLSVRIGYGTAKHDGVNAVGERILWCPNGRLRGRGVHHCRTGDGRPGVVEKDECLWWKCGYGIAESGSDRWWRGRPAALRGHGSRESRLD